MAGKIIGFRKAFVIRNPFLVEFGLIYGNFQWLGRLSMTWTVSSHHEHRLVAVLSAEDGQWLVLPLFRSVFTEIAKNDSSNLTPDQFSLILAAKGFKNLPPQNE